MHPHVIMLHSVFMHADIPTADIRTADARCEASSRHDQIFEDRTHIFVHSNFSTVFEL